MRIWRSVRCWWARCLLPRRNLGGRTSRLRGMTDSHEDMMEYGVRYYLCATVLARAIAVAVVPTIAACGGRILSSSADGGPSNDSALIPDEGPPWVSGDAAASSPTEDGPVLRTNATADAAGSNNEQDAEGSSMEPDGAAINASSDPAFSRACSSYASISGRVSCESCISEAQQHAGCSTAWSKLETQCGSQYLCVVSHCFCVAPCNTADLCSCTAGCLPLGNSPCTGLWAEAMQCVGSSCAGGC